MDPVTALAFARELIDIDSTTGKEAAAGRWLADKLLGLGYQVVEQPVDGDRFNVLAALEPPDIVLSTHFDCVPPFFPSSVRDGKVYGRGACDAKGILAAQVAAAERLRASGHPCVGLLFVVGEERGSDGAAAANASPIGSRYLVNGEPTDNRLGLATRGVYRVKLVARGRAAHSSLPHLGESAIDKLLDALMTMRGIEWPADPELGATFYSIGLIAGGIAPNVISPSADAEVMFRTIGPASELRARLDARLGDLVSLEDVLEVPPVRMTTVPGIETAVFAFTTDVPLLDRWGAPLLIGPGTVTVAHTDDEFVEIRELHEAVDRYVSIVRALASSPC